MDQQPTAIFEGTADLKPEHCINRELSWLEFNQRVLDEAVSQQNPPFERMKFLSIVSSNLDEFFMIRVASLWDQIDAGYTRPDLAGMTPRQQISAITARVRVMVRSMYDALRKEILPSLDKAGIRVKSMKNLTPEQAAFVDKYFEEQVYPVLTPMAVDSRRPFPLILNKSLNLGLLIDEGEEEGPSFATVQVPSGLSRVVQLPETDGISVVLLEQVITRNIDKLFPGRKVLCCHPYRITRNADFSLDEDEVEDLLKEVEKGLRQRRWGFAVRLEIDYRADARLVKVLEDALELEGGDAYPIHGPINLDFFMKYLYGLPGFEDLKYPPYTPRALTLAEGQSMFDRIREGDLLLYHPYDSFEPVVRFVRQAARDSKVLAIKQTLYRVSGDSPIIAALAEAADAGKQVTVLLELKARFDEENNIHWGRRLERAGAHVIYGMAGLKTHCKITLVVRSEEEGIRRYVHLGTGNYNDVTAKIYTDHGLFTCDRQIGADASAFFNMLTGFSSLPPMGKLVSAPRDMRPKFMELIQRETRNALAGKRGEIVAKMNSLVDEEIIAALYRASCAGVKIRLIVRGICCLRPGLPGVSENIQVRSIVGRFLEHSRIYQFHNDGQSEVYLSSADWMPRNLNRRVELLFPVEKGQLKAQVMEVLKLQWRDNIKASQLQCDGHYTRLSKAGAKPLNAQEELMHLYSHRKEM
ncbi:MAG TPA: RNA degradosome polyphosphate kinase [Candidatus Excrementavichristensenella intestinipullorum]|nr:RNA degradosome polyphosphate kinase [Candidatus Excrementavichristensenella intestinipullorum]